jgi:hypothetical protein
MRDWRGNQCFRCKYDFWPNYRLCMGKYKNWDHPCFVEHDKTPEQLDEIWKKRQSLNVSQVDT